MLIFKVLVIAYIIMGSQGSLAATIYLDGNLGSNCSSSNYSIVSRDCSGADGNAYNTIAAAISALSSQDTLYIRTGNYYATPTNTYTSGFDIASSKGGTSGSHTKVSAYNGETVWIGTGSTRMQYPPSPYSYSYYSGPAISIKGNYIDISGLSLYGQLLILGTSPELAIHDIVINNCNIGGGGPFLDQAWSILLHSCHTVEVKNCEIHRSGQSDGGGAPGLGCYSSWNFDVHNNYFHDNYSGDIAIKDTGGGTGYDVRIYKNFFYGPSSVSPSANYDVGVVGLNQAAAVNYIYVYNNVFLGKHGGIKPMLNPVVGYVAYNNTFVNCTYDYYWELNSANSGVASVFNNIFYHTSSGDYLYSPYMSNSLITSNYNMFFASGTTPHWISNGFNTTSFSTWQSTNHDEYSSNAISPGFVNATGTVAADFKRTSYPNDVAAGSPYGRVCGAYVTGAEVIGIDGGDTTAYPALRGGIIGRIQ